MFFNRGFGVLGGATQFSTFGAYAKVLSLYDETCRRRRNGGLVHRNLGEGGFDDKN